MPHRSTKINANLTKGAADVADVLQLLRVWDPAAEQPAEFQARAILEGAGLCHYTYSAAGDIRRFDRNYPSLDDYVEFLRQGHGAAAAYR